MNNDVIRQIFVLVVLCFMLLVSKYVISGAYFDYKLQTKALLERQSAYVDNNKRYIADIELYKSANYLFSYKDELGMKELTPEKTIIITEPIAITKSNKKDAQ